MADIYKKISEYNELAELDASGKMLVAQSDETYSVGADTMADFVKGRITMDTTPTQGSSNPVTSNGVYNAIQTVQSEVDDLEVATTPDATLTIQGKAADAKKTGDEVTHLKSAVGDLEYAIYDNRNIGIGELSAGSYAARGYEALSSTKWLKSEKFPAGAYTFSFPSTWRFQYFYYVSDTQGSQIYSLSSNSRTFTATGDFIVSGRKNDNTEITGEDLSALIAGFSVIKYSENANNLEKRVDALENAIEDSHALLTNRVPDSGLKIGRLTTGPSSNADGLRTGIVIIYGPTRIYLDDTSLNVRINKYSSFLSFNGTYIKTLRDYAPACDFVIESESYPIYIAVGIQTNPARTMTESDLETISGEFHVASIVNVPYADISMFRSIAVIGDSWTAGTIYNEADTDGVTRTGQGWGENLARQHGITCSNFAVGGTSLRTWYNFNDGITNGGLKALLESDAVGLYILSLGGSNDWQSGAGGSRGWEIGADDPLDTTTYYLGALTDISGHADYHDYPLTFYGYYGRIVEMIMEHAPNSRIILTSPNTYPTTSARCVACYTAVEEIANYYGIPYMDLRKCPYFANWKNQNMLNGAHPTAAMYSGMAKSIGELFPTIIENNQQYFRNYFGDLTTVPVTWSALVKS